MRGTGTLIVAHGGGAEWNDPVREVAAQVRLEGPVEVGFQRGVAGEAGVEAALRRLEEAGAARVVVVPLLVSRHSGHYREVAALAGSAERGRIPVVVTPALEGAPELADVLTARARALLAAEAGEAGAAAAAGAARAGSPEQRAVMVVGHGPNDDREATRWLEDLEPVTAHVRERGGFAAVDAGLVRDDAASSVRAAAVAGVRKTLERRHRETGAPVLVVPLLVSQGFLARETLPADLAGLPMLYDGRALAPHPALARWVERMVTEAGSGSAGSGSAARG